MQILHFLEPEVIVRTAGLAGVLAVIFAESGLFFGFFLPGDSLLFTAGLLASRGFISLAGLLIGGIFFAILGDAVGYAFGKKVGPSLFKREDSFFFNKKHIEKAHAFYEKHGSKAIIMARFVPIVRTFAPIVAGIAGMPYRKFAIFNAVGGVLWVVSMTMLGYILGKSITNIDAYVLPIIVAIILLSVLPTFLPLILKRFREFLKKNNTQG